MPSDSDANLPALSPGRVPALSEKKDFDFTTKLRVAEPPSVLNMMVPVDTFVRLRDRLAKPRVDVSLWSNLAVGSIGATVASVISLVKDVAAGAGLGVSLGSTLGFAVLSAILFKAYRDVREADGDWRADMQKEMTEIIAHRRTEE